MKLLIYKPSFSWPRDSGHDVHTYHLMRALASLGASISVVTRQEPPASALAGLALDRVICLNSTTTAEGPSNLVCTWLQERFRQFYGLSRNHVSQFAEIANGGGFDAIVASGLPVLPMLLEISGPLRVWYAADEWVWHHLSQVNLGNASTWSQLQAAAVKGLYERAYRNRIDAAWVVSQSDARAMRIFAGIQDLKVLPNGVDAEFYTPHPGFEEPESAIFWGRLDFGPNIQALEWFTAHVWPRLRAKRPHAQFTIMGFNPGPKITALQRLGGITVQANVPDIRSAIPRHAIVVLPFVSGGGIKNKLLEAAAMGKAIVATKRASLGLQGQPPVKMAHTPVEWIETLETLWDDPEIRSKLASSARDWVVREHNWLSVGKEALAWLETRVVHKRASQ